MLYPANPKHISHPYYLPYQLNIVCGIGVMVSIYASHSVRLRRIRVRFLNAAFLFALLL